MSKVDPLPPASDDETRRRDDEAWLELSLDRLDHLIRGELSAKGIKAPGEAPKRKLPAIDKALTKLVGSGRELAARILAERCGLTDLDLDVLLLAVAVELDQRFARLVAAFDSVPENRPTAALAMGLLGEDLAGRLRVRRRFEGDAPLRRFDLIRLGTYDEAKEDSSLADSEYLAAARVVDFLLGRREMDSYVRIYARLAPASVTWDDLHMPKARLDALRGLLEAGGGRWWDDRGGAASEGGLLLLVSGGGGSGRQALAEAVASHHGLDVILVSTRLLCTEGTGFKLYLNRILREAALQGAMPIFVDSRPFIPGDDFDTDGFSLLLSALELFPGPAAICLEKPLAFEVFPLNKLIYRVDLEPPAAPFRQELWVEALPEAGVEEGIDVYHFAKLFNFGGGGIREMVREAANRALTQRGPEARISHDDLMTAGREIQARRMGTYTRKVVPRVSLDDLIVPERTKRTIREIIQTIRFRHLVYTDWGFGEKVATGKGLCALFSGPPGTGKSMAAQVIALELGMNLFRVNLARVVSKYIGETEENLAKVFDEAKESHSILLFDEADSLFAKRTKVKSAQDRYANLEVNFLLQEVEAFEGMVVLTSNLESMIDKAFKRRLNYRVFFPFPTVSERAQIWQRHIPPRAPVGPDVDFSTLAEDFEFAGGYIKNAVVRAAQWAAESQGLITTEMFAKAAELEMAETGRLVKETD